MKILAIACLFLVALAHFAYWNDFLAVASNAFFLIFDLIFFIGTIVGVVIAWLNKEDPAEKWKILLPICFAVACGGWCMGWGSDHRSKMSEHIKGETVIIQKSTNV